LHFLFILCGRLSWLPVSFLMHVKYTASYRIGNIKITFNNSNNDKSIEFDSRCSTASYEVIVTRLVVTVRGPACISDQASIVIYRYSRWKVKLSRCYQIGACQCSSCEECNSEMSEKLSLDLVRHDHVAMYLWLVCQQHYHHPQMQQTLFTATSTTLSSPTDAAGPVHSNNTIITHRCSRPCSQQHQPTFSQICNFNLYWLVCYNPLPL